MSRRIYNVLFIVAVVFLTSITFKLFTSSPSLALKATLTVLDQCDASTFTENGDNPGEHDLEIPKIVHQIWKTSDVSTYPIAPSSQLWHERLDPMNYTVKLWTDADILDLITTDYAWLLRTYTGYAKSIQRADVARLVVVHAQGGMYADLDVFPRQEADLDCVRRSGMEAIFTSTVGNDEFSNHFFMARRNSPFLTWTLGFLNERSSGISNFIPLPYLHVLWSTGPMMVTAAFRDYAKAHASVSHSVALVGGSYSGSLVAHQGGRSWHGWDGRLLNVIGDNMQTSALLLGTALVMFVAVSIWLVFWRHSKFAVRFHR